MGEGTVGVSKPEAEIEREIDEVRRRLDKSLAELDRRRHDLMNVKLQVSKHPQAVLIAGGAAVLLLGAVFLAARRSRPEPEPVRKLSRFRRAAARAAEHPERVAREPPLWEKIAASVGTTVAVALTKRLLDRALSDR